VSRKQSGPGGPAASRRTREQLVEAIVAAATGLLAARDQGSVTGRAIAARAGVQPSIIYRYFAEWGESVSFSSHGSDSSRSGTSVQPRWAARRPRLARSGDGIRAHDSSKACPAGAAPITLVATATPLRPVRATSDSAPCGSRQVKVRRAPRRGWPPRAAPSRRRPTRRRSARRPHLAGAFGKRRSLRITLQTVHRQAAPASERRALPSRGAGRVGGGPDSTLLQS
jgi:hypothetical protein